MGSGVYAAANEHDVLLDEALREVLGLRRESLQAFADRFWSKIDRTADCWHWTGGDTWSIYGAMKVNGRSVSARQIAWSLVMGRLADGRLTATCRDRVCVRPHHMREDGSVRIRWEPTAKAGWPFEFREFATTMVHTEEAEKELLPTLLYRGHLSLGRAQALFNLTLAAQKLEIVGDQRSGPNPLSPAGKIKRLTAEYPDLAHSVGLHGPLQSYDGLPKFWWRLTDNPETLRLRPGLEDYVRSSLAQSRNYVFRLDKIDRYSPWSKQSWRRIGVKARPMEPMPEVWPFLSGPVSDTDLIALVDACVPKSLPEAIRQDVCQDLILAVLEGTVTAENLAGSAGQYTKRVFQQYPRKYGPLSLDAPAPWSDGDGRTLADTLADAPIILGGAVSSLAELRDRLREQERVA